MSTLEEESEQLQKKLDYFLDSLEEDFENIILVVKRNYTDDNGDPNSQLFRAQRGDILSCASLIRALDKYYDEYLAGLMYTKEDYED